MEKKKKVPSDRRLKKMFRANKTKLMNEMALNVYNDKMRKLFTVRPIVLAVHHACNMMRKK